LVALIPFTSAQLRLASLLVVFFVATLLHLLIRPFESTKLNVFEVRGCALAAACCRCVAACCPPWTFVCLEALS
jgi:hypothetical protein